MSFLSVAAGGSSVQSGGGADGGPSTRMVLQLPIVLAQQWAIAAPVPSFTSRSARSLFGIAEVDSLDRLGLWFTFPRASKGPD